MKILFYLENFFQNLFLSESSRNQIKKISTFKYLLVVYICSEQKIFIVANRSTVGMLLDMKNEKNYLDFLFT